MKSDFLERAKLYFKDEADEFISLLDKEPSKGLIFNADKAAKEEITAIIDFDCHPSDINPIAYHHNIDSIGKTKAFELGLIYPQDVESSLPVTLLDEKEDIRLVLDLCSAPGGKTIDCLNRFKDALVVCNDVSYKRATILSSNLERLGLNRAIITSKDPKELSDILYEACDLVILDAPCSGEGMIRKYPEILDDYDVKNVLEAARTQCDLLERAYEALKPGGLLVYSTCTFAFEEDEDQIRAFLSRHEDVKLLPMTKQYYSTLENTAKLCFLNGTEGQFMAVLRKDGVFDGRKLRMLKTVKNRVVEDFIKDNLLLNNYCLYQDNDYFYLSLAPLPDLKHNVLRYGVFLGELKKDRFEPAHCLYRSNLLKGLFKYTYELSEKEYDDFVAGLELKSDSLKSHYYLLTYKGLSLGYGKGSNGVLKNKYPKGLRKML